MDIPLLIRTPGYSFFIAILYKIFNVQDIVLIIANIIISLLSLILINKTLSLFTTSNTALIGSFLYALEPLSLSLIFYVLPQILFQFIIVLIAFLSIKLLKKNWTYKIWFLFGLSLSIASIIKPVGFYLIFPLVLGVIIFLYFQRVHILFIVKYLTILFIPLILITGGWLYRNFSITGDFTISHIKALDLIYFKAPAVLAYKENIPFEEARVKIVGDRDVWNWILINPRSEEINILESESKSILIDNPYLTSKILLKGVINTLFGPGDGQFYSVIGKGHIRQGPLGDIFRLTFGEYYYKWILNKPLLFIMFLLFLFYLFILYGGVISFFYNKIYAKNEFWINLFLFLILTYFIILSGGLETYYRFRNPMTPFFIILSSQGWNFLFFSFNKSRFK